MRCLEALRASPRRLSLAVVLIGVLAAALLAVLDLRRFEEDMAEERLYQLRELQEGLSALHRDLQMVNHLMGRAAEHPDGEAQDYVAARRDQLATVRWLGYLPTAVERPEVLLASVDMRGYDPRRDGAVAPLLTGLGETVAIPSTYRDSARLAIVLGPAEGGHSALVALIDVNQLLDDSLNALTRVSAPFDLLLDQRAIARWPRVLQRGPFKPVEIRAVSVGALDFTLAFADAGVTAMARQVLPAPLVLLMAALAIAAVVGSAGAVAARPAKLPPIAHATPAPSAELFRTRLWQLGELAASLSHDLGQPLNVIRLTAEAAQDSIDRGRVDAERLHRTLGTAVEQALRAQSLIDGLVSVTRKPGQHAAHLRPVELVRRVLARNLARLKGQGVRLAWHADLATPSVQGHAGRLEAAVQHLLVNACEALAARHLLGDDPVIRVECRRAGEGIAISVTDNGPGFPAALLPLIDDPLAPVPERSKGCGLGMALILGVAAEMGGRLVIEDAAPGTCATLLLPAARRSLLLVEDDTAAAEALAEHLSARGWQVRVARGGNPALALFQADPADVVITDLHMADGDGWHLIQQLHAVAPDLPIIAASTSDTDGARRAVTCGAAVVLRKPLGLQDICEELDGLFSETW